MEQDETLKNLKYQNELLQSKVKSYAKLGELYETAKAELSLLRAQTAVEQSEQNNGPGYIVTGSNSNRSTAASVATPPTATTTMTTSLQENNDVVNKSMNSVRSIHSPSFEKVPQSPSFEKVSNNSSLVHNMNDSTPPENVHVNSNAESFFQVNSTTSNEARNADSGNSINHLTLATKLGALACEARKLEELLSSKTIENDQKNRQIISLTDEVRQLKIKLQKGESGDDWVDVKNNETATVVTQTSLQEQAERETTLQRKVTDLTKTVTELKAANKSWEHHLTRVSAESAEKNMALQYDLDKLKKTLEESNRREEAIRAECDKTIAVAKKRAMEAEAAMQKAVAEAENARKQQEQLLTEKKAYAERRAREMENIIQGQKEYITKLETQLMSHSRIVTTNQQHGLEPGREISMPTEVMLLHQQIALWKEDFEKERADREKAQSDLEMLRKVNLEDRQQLHKERDLSRQRKDKLDHIEREKKNLVSKYNEKSLELQQLQSQLASKTVNPPSPIRSRQWNCTRCTYLNLASDRSCVICGNKSWLQLSTSQPTVNAIRTNTVVSARCHNRCNCANGHDVCDCLHSDNELETDRPPSVHGD